MTWATDTDGGASIRIHVQPGARVSRVMGLHGDDLKVAVREKAVDGEANRAVNALLAELLGVARSDVTILRGRRSRRKQVLIDGISAAVVVERLKPFLSA